ncbi:MAG TPA: hypothetical protein VH092_10175 [Urbifossiella sp.]|jgi:hypothetical protein|nr:hypothetical protein [Urbifossiella sp.]
MSESEVAATTALTVVVAYVVCVVVVWVTRARVGGPSVRALVARWVGGGGLVCAAVVGWCTAGVAVELTGSPYWQGAWAGGSAVLWLGYLPAVGWAVRAGRRQIAAARAADAGLVG